MAASAHSKHMALSLFLAGVIVAAGSGGSRGSAEGLATGEQREDEAGELDRVVAADLARRARAFLGSLDAAKRARVQLGFDDGRRTQWSFLPGVRAGLAMRELSGDERARARELLRSLLSAPGMLKAEAIMSLDSVLREMEISRGGTGASRDSLNYGIAVFGAPEDERWGFKFEGHHLSINVAVGVGEEGRAVTGSDAVQAKVVVSATPFFVGASPARVPQGGQAGLRVLADEQDIGERLASSLDEAQMSRAKLEGQTPREIVLINERLLEDATAIGVGYADLDDGQRGLLRELVATFARNLRRELAERELARVERAGWEQVRFAWGGERPTVREEVGGEIGGAGDGKARYYRITTPTAVIEYANSQDGANHVHAVWHDRERNFGKPGAALREHLKNE
ncbi:MAG: DUF3500 domain-containing protein [Planctomycetota bacterium]|nr:DUF3500 domain-containing protein [Planctomycetota bacterium]